MLRTLFVILPALLLLACATPGGAGADAVQLLRFEIVSRGPAFGGAVFDEVGVYERIVAIAHMRINPAHPANRAIVDLDRAATCNGWVDYQTDVVIVRPRDPAKASRVLLLDVPNRGARLLQQLVNEGGPGIDSEKDAGNGFLMRRGHTVVWIGWQGDIPLAANGASAGTRFPVLADAITGPSAVETVFDDIKPTGQMALAYPAATPDQAQAQLTVRAHAAAPPLTLPSSAWTYTSPTLVEVTRPAGFDAGAIYRFQYQASGARVMGLGMAALRDVTSYLKSGRSDANPLADIKPDVALALGVSQSGRFLRDLIWQGFNADPYGGKVFDGAMPLIAGSRKSFVNARFAQPGRTSTQHIDHLTYGDQFPFSYAVTTDPVSGATDGIFARCQASATCPRLMHVDSSTEFWQARASLVVTDGAGKDIALPPEVRAYLMSSTQHMAAITPTVGVCQHLNNPAQQGPTVRVLLDHLVEWVRKDRAPPPSRYPGIASFTLTEPVRDVAGFPDLRAIGVGFPDVINELTVVDYATMPPRSDPFKRYQLLVPMLDQDGHDIAGVRLPDIEVPLATHAGWNLRRAAMAPGQLCGLNGLYLPFPKVARAGDPRRPLAQRYQNRMAYAKAVAIAARALRDQGLMLEEDVARYIERALNEPRLNP